MGTAYYLSIPNIPGDSREPHHVGWHIIKRFGQGDSSSSGQKAPKNSFWFEFVPSKDALVPLMNAARNRKGIDQEIILVGWDGKQESLRLTLFYPDFEEFYLTKSGVADEKLATLVLGYASVSKSIKVYEDETPAENEYRPSRV